MSGYLVITNKKKRNTVASSNHQTTVFECAVPNVQSNRFCVCDRCHVHAAYMCVKMAHMY